MCLYSLTIISLNIVYMQVQYYIPSSYTPESVIPYMWLATDSDHQVVQAHVQTSPLLGSHMNKPNTMV